MIKWKIVINEGRRTRDEGRKSSVVLAPVYTAGRKRSSLVYRKLATSSSLTLVELLISIAVTTILFGVVILMFRTSLESFFISQEDLHLQKVLDDVLTEITGGGFESYGIIDAMEFIKLSDTSISFVPLWVDQPKDTGDNKRFFLNKAFKAGGPFPLVEVRTAYSDIFKPQSVTFHLGAHQGTLSNDDIIEFDKSVSADSKIRATYIPESDDTEVIFSLNWDKKKNVLTRKYKNIEQIIPRQFIKAVKISDVHFEYFDNTNSPIAFNSRTNMLDSSKFPFVSAIRVWAKVESQGKSREGFVFINLRNTRTAGAGIRIQEGTRIKIPDSYHIRILSILNIMGITDRGLIQIETRPKIGNIWRLNLELGFKNKKSVIKKYSIDYPPGNTVYSETIDMTTDLALNFLTLGASGRYDYDYDSDAENAVVLEGDVELVVTKMGALGASLYVRP